MRCAFIVGAPCSGTSWVWELLDAHPDVRSLRVPDVWPPEIAKGSNSMETALFVERGLLRCGLGGRMPYLPLPDERVLEILEAHDPGPGKVLLEKTPWHMAYLERIWRLVPDARVILVKRIERDRIASSLRRWGGRVMNKAKAGSLLRSKVKPHRDDPRLMVVNYEDLHSDMTDQLKRMCDHIDIERAGIVDILSEERDTYKRLGKVGSWDSLSPAQVRYLDRIGL